MSDYKLFVLSRWRVIDAFRERRERERDENGRNPAAVGSLKIKLPSPLLLIHGNEEKNYFSDVLRPPSRTNRTFSIEERWWWGELGRREGIRARDTWRTRDTSQQAVGLVLVSSKSLIFRGWVSVSRSIHFAPGFTTILEWKKTGTGGGRKSNFRHR